MNFDLLNYIQLNDNLIQKVTDLVRNDEVGILRLSEDYYNKKISFSSFKDPLTRLAVAMLCAEKSHSLYRQKGISDNIFADTFDDVRIWSENCGNKGLKNIGWLNNHIRLELFKLGRLQFQMYKCNNPTLDYLKLPFKFNQNVLYVHIPQGERLSQDACVASLKEAKEFFERYFPEFQYNYFFCESWLLFDGNKQFMKPESNIVQFMKLFDIAYSVNDEAQAFERIFGTDIKFNATFLPRKLFIRKNDVIRLPEITSLQKSAKQYLLEGNRLGVGIGTIPRQSL